RDRLRLLAGLEGPLLFVLGDEAVGKDDGRAVLALPDMAAERERPAEGEPALTGETMFDDGAPQDQDVDAGISAAGAGVPRQAEWRFCRRTAPRLHPGKEPALELGDDLAGDLVIKVRPVGAGARMAMMCGHRGSPRRVPGASLPALNPSRRSRAAL